jgi:site-specific DNA-adenine methylase
LTRTDNIFRPTESIPSEPAIGRVPRKSKKKSQGKAHAGLRPFFGYYGGKWRDTPRLYPSPEFGRIVEPFAGSAGYALRYPDRRITLCEIDPVVAGVWRYLIRVKPSEILRIPDLETDQTVDDLKICEEAQWLVGFWLNRGVSRPRKSASDWMRSEIRPGSFWGARVKSTIASQVDSIRHWVVRNCSYTDCRDFRREATWFIDPPYQAAGQHYKFGSGAVNYEDLAAWCRSRNGQVIVCENEGASWLPFRELSDTKTTRKRRSKEVYWLSNWNRKPKATNVAPPSASARRGVEQS